MKKYQQGFTLIETLIAIFILTLTVGGLLTLAANGYFAVRYARNQIIANGLMQESLEYIRNDRDTNSQQGIDWQTWLTKYTSHECATSVGCIVDPYTITPGGNIEGCSIDNLPNSNGDCPAILFYPNQGVYGYQYHQYPFYGNAGTTSYFTTYVRKVIMQQSSNPDQVTVTVSIRWKNGNSSKTITQSVLLTKWEVQ